MPIENNLIRFYSIDGTILGEHNFFEDSIDSRYNRTSILDIRSRILRINYEYHGFPIIEGLVRVVLYSIYFGYKRIRKQKPCTFYSFLNEREKFFGQADWVFALSQWALLLDANNNCLYRITSLNSTIKTLWSLTRTVELEAVMPNYITIEQTLDNILKEIFNNKVALADKQAIQLSFIEKEIQDIKTKIRCNESPSIINSSVLTLYRMLQEGWIVGGTVNGLNKILESLLNSLS